MLHSEKFRQLEQRIKVHGEKLSKIDLLGCQLSEFPLDLLLPLKDSIEMINLGGNCLSSLPEEIVQFTKLRILFFANNNFTSIPAVLGKMPSLYMLSFKANQLTEISPESLSPSIHWLILTDNQISSLPPTIGRLTHLRKCLLSGNRLESLPDEMQNCRELELLRLSVNQLTHLPDWFFHLPKLAWNAFSSNRFQHNALINNTFAVENVGFSWTDLEIREKLGEGASGEIYQATLRNYGKSMFPSFVYYVLSIFSVL